MATKKMVRGIIYIALSLETNFYCYLLSSDVDSKAVTANLVKIIDEHRPNPV